MIEIRSLDADLCKPLADFLLKLDQSGEGAAFHPHELNEKTVRDILDRRERDRYYVVVDGKTVVAYGMLRGSDEGFDVPSLGIAISEAARGTGLSTLFMNFLHHVARSDGAKKVRLTVYADNIRARSLFERLGYRFEPLDPHDGGDPARLVGFKELET